MSARAETRLWVAQRASAAVLAIAVAVHLITMIHAVRGGLSAAEIIARLSGNTGWLVFYLAFVAAVAVHAPIGLRTVLAEQTALARRVIDVLCAAFALVLLALGSLAAAALFTIEA